MDFKTLTYDVSRAYVRDYATQLGSDVTAALSGKIRARDLKGLASCSETALDPAFSNNREIWRHLMQVEAFLKKNATFTEPEKARAAALASFEEAEKRCRITNRRLDHYYSKRGRLAPDLRQWMDKAAVYVHQWIGDYPKFLEGLPKRIRFTPGATSTAPRKASLPNLKVSKRVVCTPAAEPYVRNLAEWFGYGRMKARLTVCNRVEVVPKSWKTDRTIACEPEGNLPLQLAFDGYLKDQLRKLASIDLSDQGRNQRMAQEGSVGGHLATIDLSSASDTLAYNTVAWLIPQPWFEYLCAVRSPCYKAASGELRTYAKFSSMGNGATFALETLVFAAAAAAVGSKAFAVYGDDIIVETELVGDLLRLLGFMGFIVNRDKSHWTGPFRESCGGNYHTGADITPFYLREWCEMKSILSHNINGLAAVALPGGHLWKLLLRLRAEWNLPLVPFNDNSTSGVWIDPHSAYSHKLIRSRHQVVQFKSYVLREGGMHDLPDTRSLFLWHHDAFRIKVFRDKLPIDPVAIWQRDPLRVKLLLNGRISKPGADTVRSGVPIVGHKYVRRWVCYIPVAAVTPGHLFWWSDDVFAAMSNAAN